MLRPRFASAAAALALVVGCSDDSAPSNTNGPAFEGVSYVVPDEAGRLVVAWKPAAGAVDYRVYVSRIQGRPLKTVPAARTASTSVIITPEKPNEKYYVVVRAANVSGAEDNNAVEKSAIATADKTPPTFNGAKAAEPAGNAGVKITWDPATDDFTPMEAIRYDVFGGRTKASLVLLATTGPGDTTISFNALGLPAEQFTFAVQARDVANNVTATTNTVTSALGQDATLPTFNGCDTVTALGAKKARVTWAPGADNNTVADKISYEVYVSKAAGVEDFNATPAATVVGGTEATLTNLDPGATYFVVCKARDAAKNLDANKVEKSFTTLSDVTAPVFAGLTTAQFDGVVRTVTLSWALATDDQTPQTAIVYDVYESRATGSYDFDAPPKSTSAPGATSIALTDLASQSALNWVVRARDAAGNHDENKVELSGKTETSFKLDVQNIFNHDCAVVGCHVSGPQTGGLNLSPGFSYASLVDVTAGERRGPVPPALKRVSSVDKDLSKSWLYVKIDGTQDVGLQMPALQTGNVLSVEDRNIIANWIQAGAPNN